MSGKHFTWILVFLIFITVGCSGSRKTQRKKAESGIVDVMTFNIRNGIAKDGANDWNHRKDVVVGVIEKYGSDIVGLQEAYDFQAEYIAGKLDKYEMYYVGRDDGKKAGETCAIYYLKDRYEPADHGTFWFSDTPEKPSANWGNSHLRICSWVRLMNKSDGRGLYVYNLHLDHRSQNSREESAKLLAEMISQREVKDPYILMGDFNMTLGNRGMKYLIKEGVETRYPKLFSAWHTINPGMELRTGHGFKGKTEGEAIDHILVENNVKILNANIDQRKIGGRYPSDHYPVTAKLKMY